MTAYRLKNAPTSLKALITAFLIMMSVGYVVALANAYDKTGLTAQGTAEHFRGDGSEWSYPATPSEIIEVAHAHGFSVPIMFFVLGMLFCGTGVAEKWKTFWLILPFVGMLIDHAAPWLILYAGSGWVWTMGVGHSLLGISFLVFVWSTLRELWFAK